MLKALHRLNPANNRDSFNETKDYPRPRLSRDRRQAGGTLKDVAPIRVTFVLEEADVKALSPAFDDVPFPASTRVNAWRNYGGQFGVDLTCDLRDVVEAACREAVALPQPEPSPAHPRHPLRVRLRRYGIDAGIGRNIARLALAGELPVLVLADLTSITISTAALVPVGQARLGRLRRPARRRRR